MMSAGQLNFRPPVDEDLSVAMRLGAGVRIVEALLFASREPLEDAVLSAALPQGVSLKEVIAHLETHYAARGINLLRIGKAWTFRTAADLAHLMSKETEEPRKLSRAAVETLAIIAYHQPVTRAEIEEIRGVATGRGTLDILLEAGFVRMRGRRKTPGRPITLGTTEGFLSHFGLSAVGDLPGLDELKSAGMFDGRLPGSMVVPLPTDDAALRADEDPLEADDLLAAAEARINEGDEPLEQDLSEQDLSERDGPETELDETAEEAMSEDDRLDPLEDERKR
jgi:segregation and condensation protein B